MHYNLNYREQSMSNDAEHGVEVCGQAEQQESFSKSLLYVL